MSDTVPDWAKDDTPDWAQETAPAEPAPPISFGDTTLAPQRPSGAPAERGILKRMNEGAAAPIMDLGISEENRKKYPWLNYLHPHARTAEMILKAPASAWGAISGAAAGVGEKVMGPAWADRLQRDLGVLPAAIAPEMPVAAPELSAIRRGHQPPAPVRPPPLPEMPPPLPPEVSAIPRQVPREGADVGLLRSDVPHELPAAHSRALSAAGNGGPLTELSPETIAFLRQKMEQQGFNAHTLDQRLGEMSAHHFFGEITPSLELDMQGVAGHAGPGRLEIMGSQRQRALEASERVAHIFDRGFGKQENLAEMSRLMDIAKKREADPLYQKFRDTVITPSEKIDAIMPRLEAAGVLPGVNRALKVEGRPTHHGFTIPGEPPTGANVPTAGAFQLALEQISDKVGAALRNGEKSEARRLTQLRNDLVDALDTHPNVGDTWKQARNVYARHAALQDAVEMGRNVLSGAVRADELPFLTAAYGEAEMRALRIGIRDELQELLGKKDTLTAEVVNKVLAPNNVKKLRWAIGDAATESLVSAIEHERHMKDAPARTTGQAPTATRAQAMKEWNGETAAEGFTLEDAADFAKKPVRSGVAAALKFRSAQKKAANEAKWARIREEVARIMTLQGPERDAVARYLVGKPPAPYARGGRVPMKPKTVRQNGFVYTLQGDGSYR